ncbi:MAG TPA: TonB-dependent receptor plug domain-containing protein, partial [Opitutaceae bacterium]
MHTPLNCPAKIGDWRRALVVPALLLSTPDLFSAEATPPESEEAIVLSPFEVQSDNTGYYAANSMSGTRFNTSLQDLAAPVSVITKEQMEDFGMRDVNDVFLYSANTEGTGTYSDFSTDRNGQLTDNVQMNPNTANRVRGIASANISYGNFETSTRSPLDPLILDGVEISRGPNANVFGLGNPSGTVNQVPAHAKITLNQFRTEFRWDSYDGHRVSVDINRVLIKDKLAVRFSALDEREGFVREPSGIDTNRYNAMIHFRPFTNTTIKASYLHYESEGNRPNFTPPRDYVSYWIEMGKPTWDPVTQTVHVNGQSYDHAAMIAAGNSGGTRNDNFIGQIGQPWNAFNRSGGQFQRSNLLIDQTGVVYWTATNNNTGSTPTANAGSGASFIRLMGSSPGPSGVTGKFADQPLFNSVPSVSDKSIYDWSSINLASPNFISDEVKTYYVTLDQIFLNSDRQMLAGQVGFFREDADRYRKTPIGDAGGAGGVNGQLWVDVNETNLDGTPNPYLGHTYIGVGEPTYSEIPLKWDTTRLQFTYKYDFTKSDDLLKWFGIHQVSP